MSDEAGKDVIFSGIKDFLAGDLVYDMKMHVGDEQVGGYVQKVLCIPHPQVQAFLQPIEASVFLGRCQRKIVIVDAIGGLGPHL